MRYSNADERSKLLAGVGIPPPERNLRCKGTRRLGMLVVAMVMGALLYFGMGSSPHFPCSEEDEWKSEGWFPSRKYPWRRNIFYGLLTILLHSSGWDC